MRSRPRLNSLPGRLLDDGRDEVESDVGCGETQGTSQRPSLLVLKRLYGIIISLLNDAHTHTRTHRTHTHTHALHLWGF